MMMGLIMSFVFLSSANIDDLISAKKTEEVLAWHQRTEEVLILRQRCEAEVRGSFFPTSCFLWSKKANLSGREKIFFQAWFEKACVKSLRDNASLARFHLSAINKVQGICRIQLVKSAQNWLYKVQKEGEAEVFHHLTIGNKIEMIFGHETLETRKPHRPKTNRALR